MDIRPAILFMWPWSFVETFVPPTHGGSTQNVAAIGLVASEENIMFENDDGRQMPTYNEVLAQVS